MSSNTYQEVGRNIKAKKNAKTITISIDLDDENFIPSNSGKMLLLASSGGWKDLVDDLRINLIVGKYANPK